MVTTETAILVGAGAATIGWLYTGRRARTLAKKHHTINLMLQAAFNEGFQGVMSKVSPHLKAKSCPDFKLPENDEIHFAFRFVLNHYEFIAAAIRNGDMDEGLVRDSERASVLTLVEVCQGYIYEIRDSRRRQSIYEHIEWLHCRWETRPPGFWQRSIEFIVGRPLPGRRTVVRD